MLCMERQHTTAPQIRIDTGLIGQLRQLLSQFPVLRHLLAELAQFRVILDANSMLQALMYRERHPDRGPTALEELIRSTILEVHAPRWLDTEMPSAIAQAAAKRGLSAERLSRHWLELRPLLKWDESLSVAASKNCCDRKDVPYVILECKVDADGILSEDHHIRALGGHALKHEFLLTTRDFARAIVTTVSLRTFGTILPAAALLALVDLIRNVVRWFAALPPPVQALIIVGGAAALLHPDSRKWLSETLSDLLDVTGPACAALLETIRVLSNESAQAQVRAAAALQKARGAVRVRTPAASPPVRPRRRRARVGKRVVALAAT